MTEENMRKRIVSLIALVICITAVSLLCSCNFDESKNNFSGGELLNDEKMSELKDEIASKESESKGQEIITEKITESNTGAVSEEVSESRTESKGSDKNNADSDVIVYWTSGGEKWHLSADCQYIKNKVVFEGTLEDAQNANKKAPCSKCGN